MPQDDIRQAIARAKDDGLLDGLRLTLTMSTDAYEAYDMRGRFWRILDPMDVTIEIRVVSDFDVDWILGGIDKDGAWHILDFKPA